VPSGAQSDGTAIIYGIVVDSADVPVPDANVVVGRSDGAFIRRTTTDRRGAYRVSLLLPGT